MDEFPHREPPPTSDGTNHQADADEPREAVADGAGVDSFHASNDGRTEAVSVAVVSTVAEHAATKPSELEPLYTVVDPDALESLFHHDVDGYVSFPYNGYEVVVHSSGAIDVNDSDD